MLKRVTHVSLLVRDQEEALNWFRDKLGFEVRRDDPFPEGEGRWVTMAPAGQQELEIVLQPPEWGMNGDVEMRRQMIGKEAGWVLATDNCRQDYERLQARGVKFVEPPTDLPWGVSAVFEDLYGNQHNLLERRQG